MEVAPWNPAGEPLRGRVFRGRVPLPGARVRIWGEPIGERLGGRGSDDAGALEAKTDDAGGFTFDVPDGEYVLCAESEGDTIESPSIGFRAEDSQRTVLLLFGSARVEGRVLTDEGTPLPQLPVRLYGLGPEPSRFAFVDTDAQGSFAFTGLVAGRYGVAVERSTDFDPRDDRKVRLERGGRAEVIFGFASPPVTWEGRIVDGHGDSLPGRRTLLLVEPVRRDEYRLFVEDTGAFRLLLPEGPWDVYLGGDPVAEARLTRVEVASNLETPDIALPGHVLRVTVQLSEDAPSTRGFRSRATRELRLLEVLPNGGVGLALEREELEDGRLQWLGLDAGSYVLRGLSSNLRVDGADPRSGLPVEVETGPTRELEVRVGPL